MPRSVLIGPLARASLVLAALLPLACAGVKSQQTTGGNDASVAGTSGGGGGGGGGGGAGTGGGGPGSGGAPATCTRTTTCTPTGGQYCGVIGDNCGRQLDCGACPADQICDSGLCVGGATCMAAVCGSYCGIIGDGCGHALTCASCTGTQVCKSGICADPGCVPRTCNGPGSVRYCGSVGDGCGGTLDCGTCPNNGVCGGGGVPHVCTDPTCAKVSCTPTGAQYCDMIGDGCGGAQNCGACPNAGMCGGGGAPNVCPIMNGGACQNLQCLIPMCTPTTKTSLSGTVYDPAGRVPLYNVTVYIPNAALDPIPEGVSCDRCSAQVSGHPVAAALTDTNGHFVLQNVPATTNVPLVIQVGKWRRQVTIARINPCVDNPITDLNLTRLPRSSSEGHIPKIAVTTGGSDALECFLREIGIADSEFTTDAGAGRVNLFVGGDPSVNPTKGQGAASFAPALGGGAFPDAGTLWGNVDKLLGYDLLILSCEGGQYPNRKLPYINNIKRYADAGGRLFNDHLHFYWLRNGPAPWPTTATYIGAADKLPTPVTATVDTTFPKGAAFADWLVNTGGSTTRGQLQLFDSQHSVTVANPALAQQWIFVPTDVNDPSMRQATQYLTFNTPVETTPDAQCGRVVFTDIHVKSAPPPAGGGSDNSDPTQPFPTACVAGSLSGQAKALEFLFFDLSACVQPDGSMPIPPIVPPPGVPGSPPPSVTTPPPVPPPPPPPPPPLVQ
jgi:hypothetical protein